jgi:hypothetical protein
MRRWLGHLSPASVISAVALFVSLGGVGYAAATIGSAQIKNNSVTSKDIKNRTIVTKDMSRRTVRSLRGQRGPAGQQGPAGPQGPQGPQGPGGLPPSQTLQVGAYSAHLPANMTPSDSGCIAHASDNNLLNAQLDLPLPSGAAPTAIRARYVDTSNGAVTFSLHHVVFDGSRTDDIVASGGSSDAPSEGLKALTLHNSGGLPPVSDTSYYYVIVSKSVTTHTGSLAFCGVAVDYQLPGSS